MREIATHRWGQGDTIDWYLPSRAGSPHVRELVGRFERLAVSPSAFLRMLDVIRDIDVRAVLPAIHVPTLVVQRRGDRINPPCQGRYLASHITDARYFEQPGDHSLRFASSGESDALFSEITAFLASAEATEPGRDRMLATLMLARELASMTARPMVSAHKGRMIMGDADAILAIFDAPGQAIRCAAAIRAAAGTGARIAVHTGEVDIADSRVSGTSVDIAYRIAALARPAEILVSRTVKDLLAGAGIGFAARGSHRLDEAEDAWQLFAVLQPDS